MKGPVVPTIRQTDPKAPTASRLFTHLWIAWAVLGVGSALAIIALNEIGRSLPSSVWAWWAMPGVVLGGAIEITALVRPAEGDTLSEHVWSLRGGWRSLVVVFCLWVAWWLISGDGWPSGGVAFLLWVAYHFAFEAPEEST